MEISELVKRIEALEKVVFKEREENKDVNNDVIDQMKTIRKSMIEIKKGFNNDDKVVLQCIADENDQVSVQTTSLSKLIQEESDEEIIEICTALSSKQRMGILKKLCCEKLSSGELTLKVGLSGGHLHHHLRELQSKKLVAKGEKGKYFATAYGIDVYLTVAAMNRRLRYNLRK